MCVIVENYDYADKHLLMYKTGGDAMEKYLSRKWKMQLILQQTIHFEMHENIFIYLCAYFCPLITTEQLFVICNGTRFLWRCLMKCSWQIVVGITIHMK